MYFGHLNRKNNMPRRTHFNDHTLPIGSKKQSNTLVIAAVVFMVLVCASIYFFTEAVRVDEHRGCTASAYQATQNGFDLEANLAVCN
jgi:hypothetical protein